MATHSDASLVILLFNEGFTFFSLVSSNTDSKAQGMCKCLGRSVEYMSMHHFNFKKEEKA